MVMTGPYGQNNSCPNKRKVVGSPGDCRLGVVAQTKIGLNLGTELSAQGKEVVNSTALVRGGSLGVGVLFQQHLLSMLQGSMLRALLVQAM